MNNIENGIEGEESPPHLYGAFVWEQSDENNVWNKDRGNWRKMMCNVEFHNLYCLSDTGVMEQMGKECGMHGSEGNLEEIFDWKRGREESIQKVCVNVGR